MHITKIKIKQDLTFVEYDKTVIVNDEDLLNKYSIASPEQPVSGFKKAFQAMDFFLIELCELCDKPEEIPIMCEDVNITGLSFKYKDGALLSAVITGTKQLAYSNSPLVLNTPNKSVNIDGEFNKMIHLTDPCIAALKSAISHAENYVNGERLQIEMDLKDEKPEDTEPKEFDDDKISKVGPAMRGDTTPKPKVDAEVDEAAIAKAATMPDVQDDGQDNEIPAPE